MKKILGKLQLGYRFRKISNIFSFVAILILTLGIFATAQLAQNQNTGKIQTKASTTKVTFSIYPSTETFLKDEVKFFQIIVNFTDGSANQRIDYFKTEILFNKDYLQMPSDKYVEATQSGLNRVFRVDGPTAANGSGKMVIELGADSPNSGPATDKPITLAKFYLAGKNVTSAFQRISFGKIQVVSNQIVIPIDDAQSTKGVTYTVSSSQAPSVTPTLTPSPTFTPTPTPSITPTPGPTSVFPTPTVTPSLTPTLTPSCSTKSRGDANCDGVIDGVDYSVWLNNQCHPAPNQKCLDIRADVNKDGNVDDEDYSIWINNREN